MKGKMVVNPARPVSDKSPIKKYSEGRPDLWMGLMISDAGAVQ
jgi:hypothetical protein